ncbi:hypothetical protein EJ110_NYTH26910 [Nymphaea thermarum]|nr:hypothetical protein EJ110_NYTH26910 [Nymphaea thermarum]
MRGLKCDLGHLFLSVGRLVVSLPFLGGQVLAIPSDDYVAADLWKHLTQTCSQISKARILFLEEFHNQKKGSTTVMEYIGHLKGITDQLAVFGSSLSNKDIVQQPVKGSGPDFDMLTTALQCFPQPMSHGCF